MIKNNYLPIITDTTKINFFDYINSLDVPQIDYFAIGIQHIPTKKSISLMSSPEWQKYFIDNQYAEHDPVRKITLHTKRNFIPFDQIDFIDNFGKEIMAKRASMGIRNGIILMDRHDNFNYMMTLGTEFSKFDAFDFIKRYHDTISVIKKDFITIIEKDSVDFLSKNKITTSKYLSSDAK